MEYFQSLKTFSHCYWQNCSLSWVYTVTLSAPFCSRRQNCSSQKNSSAVSFRGTHNAIRSLARRNQKWTTFRQCWKWCFVPKDRVSSAMMLSCLKATMNMAQAYTKGQSIINQTKQNSGSIWIGIILYSARSEACNFKTLVGFLLHLTRALCFCHFVQANLKTVFRVCHVKMPPDKIPSWNINKFCLWKIWA